MSIDITRTHQRLSTLRTQRTDLEATRTRLNREIERLRDARDSITTELSDHGSFRREVGQALSSIDSSRFRGNNRSRKRERLGLMREHLEAQRERHQDNWDLVRARIATREEERDAAVTRLNNVNNEIRILELIFRGFESAGQSRFEISQEKSRNCTK